MVGRVRCAHGIGGNFFGSNIRGFFAPRDITLTATASGGSVTRISINVTGRSFLGFISDGPITQMTLAAVQPTPAGFLWPSADNLVLVAAVPEPGTFGLMLAGLGVCGFMARPRRGQPSVGGRALNNGFGLIPKTAPFPPSFKPDCAVAPNTRFEADQRGYIYQ